VSDRVDILYEVRDATDLKIEAKHDVWWDALPDSGEHAWSERAKRRRRREVYRLALVTSKFRLGEEPNPVCFELHHDTEPWSVSDVTSEVEKALEDAKRQAADAQQRKIDDAVAALVKALPLPKNPDAIDLLRAHGVSLHAARRLIDDRNGRDWIIAGVGTKNDPYILKPPTGNDSSQTNKQTSISDGPIPVATGIQDRQESTDAKYNAQNTFSDADFLPPDSANDDREDF
jgi:hypothetical protein